MQKFMVEITETAQINVDVEADSKEEAEKIAKNEFGKDKMSIISGIGVRDYYRKFNYHKDGAYMSKFI